MTTDQPLHDGGREIFSVDNLSFSQDLITRREALRRVGLLLGGTVSAPIVVGVLAGCDRRTEPAADWTPEALSAKQNEMVASIAEHIIPRTDTPGAREARVNEFIDVMLADYYPADERAQFLAGLAQVDERSRRAYGAAYLDATPAQQLALIETLDREARNPQEAPAEPEDGVDVRERTDVGPADSPLPPGLQADTIRWKHVGLAAKARAELPFFRTMKELTLAGYYTSEVGATQELRHEPTPGRFDGCLPFSEIGRAWAV